MLSKNCNTCDWPSPYTNALLYCLSASAMLVGYQRLVAITQRRCLLCEDAPTGATGMNPDMACAWGWRYWSRAWGWCYWCRAWGWCYWCRAWGFFESERVSMNPFYISSVDIDDWFTCNDDDITYNLFNIECKTAEIKGISAIAWVSAMFRKQLQRRWQASITWNEKSSTVITVSINHAIKRVFGGVVVEKAMGCTCSQPLRRVVDFGPCASVPQRRCADGVEIVWSWY